MMTKDQYIDSLRGLHLNLYSFGKKVENVVDNPIVRPSLNSFAATYELAEDPQYEDLMTATSNLTGKKVNRFTHLHQSTDDLIKKVKMQRLLGRRPQRADLWDAAQIDGCNNARFFVSIVLPNSSTIIAVIGLFYAVDHWLSYWNAMLYITKSEMYPLQLVLRDILLKAEVALQNAQSGTDLDGGASIVELLRISESVKYIVVIAGTLPLLIAFPFVEKYFVKGVMIGSVKG